MTEKEKLILAALKFRDEQLWDVLNDAQIFAVQKPSGEIIYCCVMGQGGDHYALGMYRGKKGFSTYLKTLNMAGDLSDIDQFRIVMTFDCINCEFVPANDNELSKSRKELIRKVAADNGMKIRRPNGWPSFVRMNGGVNYFDLTDVEDIANATLALEAGIAVAKKVAKCSQQELDSLGFEDEYALNRGGKVIPLLTPGVEGEFVWSKIMTPPLEKDTYEKVIFDNKKLAKQLKSMPHYGAFQCCFTYMASSWGDKDKIVYPRILLFLDANQMIPIPVMVDDEDAKEEDFLKEFGEASVMSGSLPLEIEVCDDATEALLADFCKKTGITLTRVTSTPELDQVLAILFSQMM